MQRSLKCFVPLELKPSSTAAASQTEKSPPLSQRYHQSSYVQSRKQTTRVSGSCKDVCWLRPNAERRIESQSETHSDATVLTRSQPEYQYSSCNNLFRLFIFQETVEQRRGNQSMKILWSFFTVMYLCLAWLLKLSVVSLAALAMRAPPLFISPAAPFDELLCMNALDAIF